jgi:hypothetical protein
MYDAKLTMHKTLESNLKMTHSFHLLMEYSKMKSLKPLFNLK